MAEIYCASSLVQLVPIDFFLSFFFFNEKILEILLMTAIMLFSLQGFVVVETNFRMYAYSSSKLHCEILRLFSRYHSTLFDSLLCILYSFFSLLGRPL